MEHRDMEHGGKPMSDELRDELPDDLNAVDFAGAAA